MNGAHKVLMLELIRIPYQLHLYDVLILLTTEGMSFYHCAASPIALIRSLPKSHELHRPMDNSLFQRAAISNIIGVSKTRTLVINNGSTTSRLEETRYAVEESLVPASERAHCTCVAMERQYDASGCEARCMLSYPVTEL